ncbi:nitric oxide synthase-interacting protein [Trichonephila clavata]|uniref:Nitric oxide synthase-interacting protein n=1 Tax=Trichonephila clavata TaxID=2740835 RepID=A0A8X6HQV2_TRICU|nr:nitric oxide synthase-interacting protein [Trichonephila clavata]
MSGHASSSTAGREGNATSQNPIGKISVKDFDCCCLTLKPCTNPVITPSGFLYDKRPILDYIDMKKKEFAKHFIEVENRLKESSKEPQPPLIDVITGKEIFFDFWIPDTRKQRLERIEDAVKCPVSGGNLRVRDLIDVHFTQVNDLLFPLANKVRYMCAVTHEVLENSVPMAVLRTSGNVVTLKCAKKLIKKDKIDPTNGKPLTKEDIIPLEEVAGFDSRIY